MKNLLTSFFTSGILISAFYLTNVSAGEADKLDGMANLQLAMLTLSEKKSLKPKVRLIKSRNNKQIKDTKKTQNKADKKQDVEYPTNCLEWNATQINRKAQEYNESIYKYSRLHRVDGNLVKSIITAESCFRTKALSNKGARGLMQLIPETAERFGVKDIFNAEQNIKGGIKYLRFLLERFKGDLAKTIAAYNAGEGAVDKYDGIPPYRETKNYVKNVLKIYKMLTPKKIKKKKTTTKKTTKKITKKVIKKKIVIAKAKKRVHAVYRPPKLGNKPGRHGWQYNKQLAPQLYKH